MQFEAYHVERGYLASWMASVQGEEYRKLLEVFSQEAQKKLSIPGFREGKAPLKVVASAYGESFYRDAAVELAQAIYLESVRQLQLRPVSEPLPSPVRADAEELRFLFRVELYPQVTLRRYKGLEAFRPDDTVSDAEMEAETERFRDNHREVLPAERQEREDDLVYFSVHGTADGADYPGGTASGLLQRFDYEEIYPGLKEHLRGARPGDSIEYETDIPADAERWGAIAGKRVRLKVRVTEIKERRLRPVDDELFRPAYASYADFLTKRRAELERVRKLQADDVFEQNLRRALARELEGEIPDSMVEEETAKRLRAMSSNLRDRGGITAFLREQDMTAEDLEKRVRAQAEEAIRFMLAADKVAEAEEIDLEDDERRERKVLQLVGEYAIPASEEPN